MSSLRYGRSRALRPPLLLLLVLFAVAATACNDLDTAPPLEVPDDSSEAVSEDPASEPAADDAESADEAPEGDAAADDGADVVEPITADDVADVCADEEARTTTAEELAPLVGLTAESFESVACSAVESE